MGESIICDNKNYQSMYVFPSANLSRQGLNSPPCPCPKGNINPDILESQMNEKNHQEVNGFGELSTCDANSSTNNQTAFRENPKLKDN